MAIKIGQIARKFARDAGLAVAAIALAVIVNNWTGIVDGVNDALPGDSADISAAYSAVGFAAVLGFYRLVRAKAGNGPDVG